MLKSPRIVVIGGGTGAPVVIHSLLLAGYSDLQVICVSMDSGGKTGTIRTDERDRVIAISDLLRCLLALVHPKHNHRDQVSAFLDLAGFTDGRNRNLGYTIYYSLMEKYSDDFSAAQTHLENLLGIKFQGSAIPVTTQPTHICFSTESKAEYHGEHELDRLSMSANPVTSIWLEPPVAATPAAIAAIKSATHVIYAPGSVYGSVLANFLPAGITAALAKSSAQKILITNLVSTRNQTHNFTPLDYYNLFREYTKLHQPFTHCITPDVSRTEFATRYPLVTQAYAWEHSYFLGWDKTELAALTGRGVTVIPAHIYAITPKLNRLRHDPLRLSKLLRTVIN